MAMCLLEGMPLAPPWQALQNPPNSLSFTQLGTGVGTECLLSPCHALGWAMPSLDSNIKPRKDDQSARLQHPGIPRGT